MKKRKSVVFLVSLTVSTVALAALMILLSAGPINAALASESARLPEKPLVADPGDVVINEFVPKGTEWIELYNPTPATVSLIGWYLTDGEGTDNLTGTIPPGGYLVTNTNNINLDNVGDEIMLYDDGAVLIDQVAYGTHGGAPIAPVGDSTARTPSGADTDDDARDWTIDQTPTQGAVNDAPGVALGSSLIINEMNNYSPPADDAMEFYNPLTVSVPITGWLVSDGDGWGTITTTAVVPAGGWLVIDPNDYSVFFTGNDVAYLFQPDGIRVDQIGWSGENEDDTFQRIPDGAGPNDGYDWTSSGGDVTWFDLPETLGSTNVRSLSISKDGPGAVFQGEVAFFTITYGNMAGDTAQSVVITEALPAGVEYGGFITYTTDLTLIGIAPLAWDAGAIPSNTTGLTFTVWVTFTGPFSNRQVVDNVVWIDSSTAGFNPVSSTLSIVVLTGTTSIHDIQGAGHLSPLSGQAVLDVHGIVTAKRYNGFYMQDPNPDGDVATSEAIYVYTGGAPSVDVGDEVLVSGQVDEYYPGGYGSGNLSTSQLGNATVVVSSTGNGLPTPITIGNGGRVPPAQVIDDDALSVFDPTTDGIDFYESLEAMLVQVNDAVAVGSTSKHGEIPVVGDNGANAGLLTPRGGIVVQADDFNPERIIVDDALTDTVQVNAGASFIGPITGVLDYSYGNFKLLNSEPLPGTSGGVVSETTTAPTTSQLRVASFNVYNLDPGDSVTRCAGLAGQIVDNLQSPDIIGLQEIQDNSGETNDGIVDATATYTTLIAAIQAAGGPTYEFCDVSPQNNQDGGAPGSNIRVGFLFRTDRGLTFVDRPGAVATTTVTVTMGVSGVELSYSPGRIDPTNIAFNDSRKPLAGEFIFDGRKMFVVVNHFNSKGGDDALFGHTQPPVLYSEVQRLQQAQVVNDFVDSILALDANANVIVLGDLNDFQFSTPISDTLAAGVLTNLMSTLPITEQYTYIYDGNSQVLDHILVSDNLFQDASIEFDIVHVNAEFAYSSQRPSDHDPVVATFTLLRRVYLPLVMRQY